MFNILRNFIDNYKAGVQYNLFPAIAVKNFKYTLVFKTTNYCWFQCPHCCEQSGPDQEKTYIDSKIICDYLAQAKQDPLFSNNVVFTGGEVFSAYKFGDKNYVKDILNFALDNNIQTNIKTNAGWARTSWGQQIFTDLKEIAENHDKHNLHIPDLSLSLSIDNYHTNCIENSLAVMDKLVGSHIFITASSFSNAKDKLKQFEDALSKKFNVCTLQTLTGKQIKLLNDKTLYHSSYGTLFDGGRARNMKESYQTPYPQFSFLDPINNDVLIAFDNFGRVTLGENSGRKILTPWVDQYKKERTLSDIRNTLIKNTLQESLYVTLYDRLFR